jgi:hypothetical protein
MAPESTTPTSTAATMRSIKRMLTVGALFVGVGYLLVGMALFLELTQFHPAIDAFVATHTGHSLAGGGPDRAGMAALNADLAVLAAWPSTLLWLKLGGVAHILTGVFVALAAIVRALAAMPDRLGSMMTATAPSSDGADHPMAGPADD